MKKQPTISAYKITWAMVHLESDDKSSNEYRRFRKKLNEKFRDRIMGLHSRFYKDKETAKKAIDGLAETLPIGCQITVKYLSDKQLLLIDRRG